jgi:DNA-binding SARP family transcriptional activator
MTETAPPPLVRVLGSTTVRGRGVEQPVRGRLDRLLLVRLTLADGKAVSVDALIDALWPEDPPRGARNALQVKMSRLRALLGRRAGLLSYANGAYRLALAAADSDVGRFSQAISTAEAALAAGDTTSALAQLRTALALWPGDPFAEFAADPTVAAERVRLTDLHLTALEAHAEAQLSDPATRSTAIATVRGLLDTHPLRPRAREVLMRGLEATGRRADALAAYDAGRRLHLQQTGLEPPERLTAYFDELLAAERADTRRATMLQGTHGRAPEGLLDAARWVADDGDLDGGMRLALRGVWWWWIGGGRNRLRELLDELVERDGTVDHASRLTAEAWRGVLHSHSAQAAVLLARGEQTLRLRARPPWTQQDALAAVLIAERFFERGDPARATRLLTLARRHYGLAADDWGLALCGVVSARGQLLAGDVHGAYAAARARLDEFTGLGDGAGQVICLDVVGYCAEVLGDLHTATRAHRRALALARRVGSPEWEATQLVRLGNLATLRADAVADRTLAAAADLSTQVGSAAITALCRNGSGISLYLTGEREGARAAHRLALDYYRACDSEAGLAYTEARLALVETEDPTAAHDHARSAVRRAVRTRDPRAVAHGLESVGLVSDQPARAARCLGAASALRARTAAPLPERLDAAVHRRRADLEHQLGSAFETHWRRGESQPLDVAGAV